MPTGEYAGPAMFSEMIRTMKFKTLRDFGLIQPPLIRRPESAIANDPKYQDL